MIEFISSFLGELFFADEDPLDRKRRMVTLTWTVIGLTCLVLAIAAYGWFVAHMVRSFGR